MNHHHDTRTYCPVMHKQINKMEYPTSSTIPFPFESGPYPQQAALMDTMLQSLQIVDDEQIMAQQQQQQQKLAQNGSKPYEENIGDVHYEIHDDAAASTHLSSRRHHRHQRHQTNHRRANVMILESPTGTGKSLSLACASLAWLRYREQMDFQLINDKNRDKNSSCSMMSMEHNSNLKNNSEKNQTSSRTSNCASSSSSNNNNNNKYSKVATASKKWLDEWTPPQEIEKQKLEQEKKTQCYQRSNDSRKKLQHELQKIRKRIKNRHEVNKMKRNDRNRNDASTSKKDLIMKCSREEIAKEAIQSVKAQEQSMLYRNMKKKKKKMFVGQDSKVLGGDDIDYCVEEYTSDNDTVDYDYNKRWKSGYNSASSADDDNDDDDDREKDRKGTNKAFHEKNNDNRISAQILLDGGLLDGSGVSNHRVYDKYNKSSSFTNADKREEACSIGDCEAGTGVRKIIYAARTHSQLSQFVNEVHRTAWGADVRIVALGGRKLLCGNKDVTGASNKIRSEVMITEKCLDLQKGLVEKTGLNGDQKKRGRKREKNSCPMMSSKEAISTLALHMLAQPSDIEDLVGLGEQSHTCAYYASRESLKAAEVVVVPYNTLLSKDTRRAVGLSLKSSLVIIDEAHNIPEALRSLSSSKITLPIIEGAMTQLHAYVQKYASRLCGRNITYLNQIRKILIAFSKHLKTGNSSKKMKCSQTPVSSCMVTATELQFKLKLDNINIFNIINYLERSRLSQKLHGFNNLRNKDDVIVETSSLKYDDPNFLSKHISCMSLVETFLKCLCGSENEGRVIVEYQKLDVSNDDKELIRSSTFSPCFRYLLLDPSVHFKNVMDEAHAIVMAGGTLRPFPHIATELFGDDEQVLVQTMEAENETKLDGSNMHYSCVSRNITTFSCDHVVSSDNVSVNCLSIGPSNIEMDFRHFSRSNEKVCHDLGLACIAISAKVPAGFVIFFSSYTYEAYVVRQWKKSGLFEKLNQNKKVFREPKSAGDVEKTLSMYSKYAQFADGAILLCVINGKMSEGINFANDMARCVLVVGLPYPDITDPELKEKMQLLDRQCRDKKSSVSGQAYYQNLCMRSVNQSIGRAIRHIHDYASIILADVRYISDPRIWNALPHWLTAGTHRPCQLSFTENLFAIQTFFQDIKDRS